MAKSKCFRRRFVKAVSLFGRVPHYIAEELRAYGRDVKYGMTLEWHNIRPATQILVANYLRDALAEPGLTMNLGRRAGTINRDADMGTSIPTPIGIPLTRLVQMLGIQGTATVAIWVTEGGVTGGTVELTILNW